MNSKILIAGVAVLAILIAGITLLNSKDKKEQPISKVVHTEPEQIIVLLDLSDRIIQPGQIDADKKIIEKVFEEFEKESKGAFDYEV